jgi:thioredoxin reductase|nr:NAD(P)/FAD-dependent oxidoreductase [Kofleriaceae bacterium]
MYEVVIVGGSYAGLSAALQLARARRRVLVVDAGVRRNRFASHAHGFLSRDGIAPGELARLGKEQLLAYPTVTWRDGRVGRIARRADDTLEVDGEHALRVILATGVRDDLPAIPGLAERWGDSVFHCPYCHGYELDRGAVGVLGTHPMAEHPALLLVDWGGPVTYLAHGHAIADDARAHLLRRGVAIEAARIADVRDRATVVLDDGRQLAFAGLLAVTQTHPSSPVAAELGCAIATGPTGGTYIQTDAMKQTTVPNVFAAGDAAMMMASIPLAVADGVMAGASAHRSLVMAR